MIMGVSDDTHDAPAPEEIKERVGWIRDREIADTAIEDYLKSRDIDLPDGPDVSLKEYTAEKLTEDGYQDLRQQFRFGGKQSLNFFVITGISDRIRELESKAVREFPTPAEVQDQAREPFLVDTREIENRLYLICGHYVSQRSVDLDTGHPRRTLEPEECVTVVSPNTDLVHVRTADVPIARKICGMMARAVGIDLKDDKDKEIFYKPNFDEGFVDKLSEHIEKYVNMTVRVNEGADRTAGSIRFTSTTNEAGDYLDLREDEGVKKELEEGTIQRGYVLLSESDFAFEMNRKQSKIWLRSYEREERLMAMAKLIDNVLKESGGYPQRTLQGFGNVPE